MTKTLEWSNPELLANANAWAAYQTVMAILAETGASVTAESIRAQAAQGRARGPSLSPTTSAIAGRPPTRAS